MRKGVIVNLSTFAGTDVYIRLSLSGLDSTVSISAHDIWTNAPVDTLLFPKNGLTDHDLTIEELFFGDDQLFQNWPNPFNPSTTIEYFIPLAGNVRLSIHDLLGRELDVIQNGFVESGRHVVECKLSDVSSGTYIYKLDTPRGSQIRTMKLIK